MSRSTLVLKAIAPPRSSRSPCKARMKAWLSTMPVSGECSAATQLQRRLHCARGRAVDHGEALDAVGLALLEDRFHLADLGVFGGDDQLAAFPVRHAVRGAELVPSCAGRADSAARAASRSDSTCRRGSPRCCARTRRCRCRWVASATITSWPLSAAARATASPTTPAPMTRTCMSVRMLPKTGSRFRGCAHRRRQVAGRAGM